MDVVCGRCRAEYEFDDALISERGTTVRCTNCGLQFKVFPPVGLRAPEIWRVFDPANEVSPAFEYESLRDLQKGIAQGDVRAEHLLARGDEPPRPLVDIVELKPLLHQPRSDPPPPASRGAESETEEAPESKKEDLPPEVNRAVPPPLPKSQDFVAAPTPPIPLVGDDTDSRPKIRSALSVSSVSTAADLSKVIPSDEAEARDTPTNGSAPLAPPRQSLRSTLMSPPSVRPSASPEAASTPPPVISRESPIPESSPETPSAVVHSPVAPEVVSATFSGPQMTPTPKPLRAYQSQDAQPVSSVAGSAVKQRAKSGALVLSVLLGALAFLGFAGRHKLSAYLTKAPQAESEKETRRELSAELLGKIEMADAAWMSKVLLKVEDDREELQEARLAALARELEETGATPTWHGVNLKRIQGDLSAARSLAPGLPQGTEQSYALALLDLAESEENPPWALIIDRLKEASTGERGRFLARSAYIYALSASGEGVRARVAFDAFEKLAGAQSAPLYGSLKAYLEREAETEPETEDVPVTLADLEPAEAVEKPPTQDVAPPKAETEEPKPKPAAEITTPDPKPNSGDVSAAVKAKVAEADAMWRGGNQSGAVVIYKQVVAEIGTAHFLGQRSAARIRQAEVEKAGSK